MATADNIRNNIIDRLLTIKNKDYLTALQKLLEKNTFEEDILKLTEEQKLMLQLSEEDIKHKRFISQSQLDNDDLKWLNEQ